MPAACLVIAEAGVNHNGDFRTACALIDAAAEAGADAVKFQSFRPEALATEAARTARYQGAPTSQMALLKTLALTSEQQTALARRAEQRGLEFLSTPFDLDSLQFLVDQLGARTIKLSSGDLTNGPLLMTAAKTAEKLMISTGMATPDEIGRALALVQLAEAGRHPSEPPTFAEIEATRVAGPAFIPTAVNVILMQCTSAYPTPPAEVNLRAMVSMRDLYGVPVGLSDHTDGVRIAGAAVAMGAVALEKHFTLSKSMEGPDHKASLTVDELAELVATVRDVTAALGSREKAPTQSEIENRPVVRRSLVAARPIRRSQVITADDITAKRPGGGLCPMRFGDIIGKRASRDYSRDDELQE